MRKLFKRLALNPKALVLNGSFLNSYWASDIDLYEDVSDAKPDDVVSHVRALKVKALEVKVAYADGTIRRFKSTRVRLLKGKPVAMIKLDTVVKFLAFPIELSIIYAFKEQELSREAVIKELFADIKKKAVYKGVKRLNSIAKLRGQPNLYDDITENTRFGVINLSNERLKLLKQMKLGKREKRKYLDTITEDLRRYGLKIGDNLEGVLNDDVLEALQSQIS